MELWYTRSMPCQENGAWLRMFQNARKWVGNRYSAVKKATDVALKKLPKLSQLVEIVVFDLWRS